MADNVTHHGANDPAAGWLVEIAGGSAVPQGTYSMSEIDPSTCAFRRPGGPSFEMSTEDVVSWERKGVLHVVSPVATNDNC